MGLMCDIYLDKLSDVHTGESYFELLYNEEPIISINNDPDREEQKERLTFKAGVDAIGIYYGILGLLLALYKDHKITKDIPWPEIISKKGKGADSNPLFIPVCTVGCCGYEDIDIKLRDSTIIIIRSDGKQWDIPLNEYVNAMVKCINEILTWSHDPDKHQFKDYAWFALWLAEKVTLESTDNVRALMLPQLSKILDGWNLYYG